MRRPVNSSTMTTSPSLTTYSLSRWYSACAFSALSMKCTAVMSPSYMLLHAEHLLDLRDALLGQRHRVVLLLEDVVDLGAQLLRDRREAVVLLGDVLGGRADDERRPRLVDEDRVGLVDDREVEVALHHAREVVDHVVAQVVEAELAVLAVGDVGEVCLAPRDVTPVAVALVHRLEHDARVVDRGLVMRDVRDAHAEEVIDRRHPAGARLGEVVVRRDQVRALAGERVQIQRGRGDERLAFTGLHLRDVALVERHRAHELLVEVPLAERRGALPRERRRTPPAGRRRASLPSRAARGTPPSSRAGRRQKGL